MAKSLQLCTKGLCVSLHVDATALFKGSVWDFTRGKRGDPCCAPRAPPPTVSGRPQPRGRSGCSRRARTCTLTRRSGAQPGLRLPALALLSGSGSRLRVRVGGCGSEAERVPCPPEALGALSPSRPQSRVLGRAGSTCLPSPVPTLRGSVK